MTVLDRLYGEEEVVVTRRRHAKAQTGAAPAAGFTNAAIGDEAAQAYRRSGQATISVGEMRHLEVDGARDDNLRRHKGGLSVLRGRGREVLARVGICGGIGAGRRSAAGYGH